MREFYVFLHSGASSELFDNTLNNFSVKLPETLNVEGYSCSLVEISIPKNTARTLTPKVEENQLRLVGSNDKEKMFGLTLRGLNLMDVEKIIFNRVKEHEGEFYHDGRKYVLSLPQKYYLSMSSNLSLLMGKASRIDNVWTFETKKFDTMTPGERYYRINTKPGDYYQIVKDLVTYPIEREKFEDFETIFARLGIPLLLTEGEYHLEAGNFHLNPNLQRALNVSFQNGAYRPLPRKANTYPYSIYERKSFTDEVVSMPSLRYTDDTQIVEILKEITTPFGDNVKVKYDKLKKRIGFEIKKTFSLTLTKIIASFLGFGDKRILEGTVFAENSVNYFPLGINTFLYCSCVEESIVGDCKARILRVIPSTSSEETIIHRKYTLPLPYKVDAREISTISCSLRLDNGSLAPLEGGQSVWLILKFRENESS
jgi:hypothetical protein